MAAKFGFSIIAFMLTKFPSVSGQLKLCHVCKSFCKFVFTQSINVGSSGFYDLTFSCEYLLHFMVFTWLMKYSATVFKGSNI